MSKALLIVLLLLPVLGFSQKSYYIFENNGANLEPGSGEKEDFLNIPSTFANACYVDPNDGNDANDGSSPSVPVATLARAQALKANYTVIALSDTVHSGTIVLNDWDGTSETPKKITTYNKYNKGKATIKGFKTLTGWTHVGKNKWSVVDNSLPATRAFYLSRSRPIPYKYFLSWLLVNGVKYGFARTPNTGTYQNSSIAVDGMSYMIDSDLSMSTNQYQYGYIYAMVEDWAGVKAQIMSNTATRFNFYTEDLNENNGGYDLNNKNMGSTTHKYVIANHTNCMDLHGEWVYKCDSNKLYLQSTVNPNIISVMAPNINKVIDVYQSSYLTIDNIEIWGGNVGGIQIENSNEITIKNCEVYYSGYAGINLIESNNSLIDSNKVGHIAGNGIAVQYTMSFNDHTITHNHVYDCGVKGYACDRDGYQTVGILSRFNDGADQIDIMYNFIDGTGGNGISHNGSGTDDDEICGTSFRIDYNFINNYCAHSGDGGGIYTGMMGSSTKTKSVSHNFIMNASQDYTFRRDNRPFSMGIYNDNTSKYIATEYNTIYNVQNSIFVQYNSRNNLYRYNTIVKHNVMNNYVLKTGGLYRETYNDGAGAPLTWTYNDVVLTDNVNSRGVSWTSDGTPYTVGVTMNYNDYYTPFRNDNIVFKSLESRPSFVMVDYTMADWTTFTGWEASSTLNKNNWRFSNVSGITADQFVWLFCNWSPAIHVFSLGSASFRDLDGNILSDSVSVPAYSSRVLFYSSGSLTGLANPIYTP